jgi:hypothetical protein
VLCAVCCVLCGGVCICVSDAGAWPSPRRSHAAVIMGGSLWVSGGLDSSGVHLADLWRCDLASWQWQQLGAQVGPGKGEQVMAAGRQLQV